MPAPERPQRERLRLFLAELAVLRAEYGMEVGGCGECGSPWVTDIRDPDGMEVGFYVDWDVDEGVYVFHSGSILDD